MNQTTNSSENQTTESSLALGQALRDERIKSGMSVADAARELKLKPEDIHRFENGTHSLLTVYEKGSLKAYTRLLDVPLDDHVLTEPDDHSHEAQIGKKFRPLRSFVASTALAKTWIVSIVLLSFVGVGFLIFRLLAPPTLIVHSPTHDQYIQSSSIEVSGRTTTGSEVFINGTPVLVDLEGNFSDTFLLRPGVNEVTITATNSLDRTAHVERIIVAEYENVEPEDNE